MKNYSEMSQGELDVEILDACSKSDLEKVKYLLESPHLKLHASIHANPYDTYDSPITAAANAGSLEIVKYLMTKGVHPQDFHISLGKACESGHLEIVKYFLLQHADKVDINDYIYTCNGTPLVCAFYNKSFEVIDFLLNSPELKEHAKLITIDDDMSKDDLFYSASYGCSDEIIELVMNSKQFKSYPEEEKIKALGNAFWGERKENIEFFINHKEFDFKKDYENVFIRACQTHNVENIRYLNEFYDFKESDSAWESILKNKDVNPDFIQYLLIEKDWNPTQDVVDNLKKSNCKDFIESLIKIKELNHNLDYNLKEKETTFKKLKI